MADCPQLIIINLTQVNTNSKFKSITTTFQICSIYFVEICTVEFTPARDSFYMWTKISSLEIDIFNLK